MIDEEEVTDRFNTHFDEIDMEDFVEWEEDKQ